MLTFTQPSGANFHSTTLQLLRGLSAYLGYEARACAGGRLLVDGGEKSSENQYKKDEEMLTNFHSNILQGHWHAYATPNNQEVEICYKVERVDYPEEY